MATMTITQDVVVPIYDIDSYGQMVPMGLHSLEAKSSFEVTRMNDKVMLNEGLIMFLDTDSMSIV
jgi:hypothetical protein